MDQAFPTTWPASSRKHLRTKVIPDLHLTYSKKRGKSGVGIKTINGNFSIKSYVVAIYKNRLAEAILIDSHNI